MSLTKAQIVALIEDDILGGRTDKTTMVGYCINFGLNYMDKSGTFKDLHMEETVATTISCTFETTDVDTTDNIITVSIDIPTGTKLNFTAGDDDGDAIPAGLEEDTDYWAIRESSTTIKVASTYKNAWIGTAVSMTDTGTGTHTVYAYRERMPYPDNCKYIKSIRLMEDGSAKKLEPISPENMDRMIPFPAYHNNAKPKWYVEWKDWYSLYPVPDDTYILQVRYVKYQDAFDDDADTAEVAQTDDLIVLATAMYAWKMLGEPEQSAIFERELEKGLYKHKRFVKNMKPDLVLKPHQGTMHRSASDRQDDPFCKY